MMGRKSSKGVLEAVIEYANADEHDSAAYCLHITLVSGLLISGYVVNHGPGWVRIKSLVEEYHSHDVWINESAVSHCVIEW